MLSEQIAHRVIVDIESGCWEWQGSKDPKGYGQLTVKMRHWRAHRYAWYLANGAIPDGLCVCHHCDNPSCCGIGDHSGHGGWRFCNACGFSARCAVWDRLSSQAARIVELEAALSQIAMAETGSFEIVKMYPEDDGGWSCDVCERMQELARRALGEPTP